MYENIQLLHHLILPSNLNDAFSYLDQLDWFIELHKIYQHFFPEEYQQDKTDWLIHDDLIHPWQLNLFKLIDDNLFSLPDSLVLGEELFSVIPACPFYPDWWDIEFEDLPKAFQLVIYISGNIDMSYFSEIPEWLNKLLPLLQSIDGCDFLKLEALCKQAGSPLTALPKVIEILDHCTGNTWLDSTNEAYSEFDWTVDNVEKLRADWLECEAISSKIKELDEWLNTPKNIVRFCQLFYECDNEPHYPEPLMTVLQPYL
jgi:hypothetical protein